MARTLSFDPDEVVQKAMRAFWENGVEHVSIRDLVDVTGVQRSGLYNVFGNKDGLFKQSFELYIQQVVKRNFSSFFGHADADIQDVKTYFSHFNELVEKPAAWSGCLMCNTASSNAAEAEIVEDIIGNMFAEIITYFERAFRNSREKGLISVSITDRVLAESMLGNVVGLSNLCRSPKGRPLVKSHVKVLLKQLDEL